MYTRSKDHRIGYELYIFVTSCRGHDKLKRLPFFFFFVLPFFFSKKFFLLRFFSFFINLKFKFFLHYPQSETNSLILERSEDPLRIIIRVKINRASLCPFRVASSGTRTNSRVQLERNAYITIPYIIFRFYKFISPPQPYPENQSSNFLIVSNLSR